MLWLASVVVVLIVLWIVVKLIKEIKMAKVQYINIVDYLMERGAKKVVLVPPQWFGYGMMRLYGADGSFIEELMIKKEMWWFIGAIASELKREGFEVEVKRV
jgi:hypothetical protein